MTQTTLIPFDEARQLSGDPSQFPIGRVSYTEGLSQRCTKEQMFECLLQYALGFWGHVPPEVVESNDWGRLRGQRLTSVYGLSAGRRPWKALITSSASSPRVTCEPA